MARGAETGSGGRKIPSQLLLGLSFKGIKLSSFHSMRISIALSWLWKRCVAVVKLGFAWILEERAGNHFFPPWVLWFPIHRHRWGLRCSAPTGIWSVALLSGPGSEPCPALLLCEGFCPQVGSSLGAGARTGVESTN